MFFGLLGYPLRFSLSPVIYRIFAEQIGVSMDYRLLPVTPDNLFKLFATLQCLGISGLNVTVPFKQIMFDYLKQKSVRAVAARAVNVVTFSLDGEPLGDNTDGLGLVCDLQRLGCSFVNNNILIVGAGGAVAGIIPALLAKSVAKINIYNRTLQRARVLANRFSEQVKAITLDDLEQINEEFDVVIFAVSGGSPALIPGSCFGKHTIAYDLTYKQKETPFLNWALKNGVLCASNGLGMLVEQAAESFKLFTGYVPDVSKARKILGCN